MRILTILFILVSGIANAATLIVDQSTGAILGGTTPALFKSGNAAGWSFTAPNIGAATGTSLALSGNATSSAGTLSFSPDIDSTHILGRLRIAMRPSASDQVQLSHFDQGTTSTNWGLAFPNNGDVYINTPTSSNGITLLENGTGYLTLEAAQFRFTKRAAAATPIITFASDTNTGIDSLSADSLDFMTAGVRRGGWTATGDFESGNGVFSGALTVGGGSTLSKLLSATATLDFPSIAALDTEELTITVTGATAGDSVSIGLPAAPDAGLMLMGWVSAADTVTIRVYNSTGSAIDLASGTFRATVIKF